MPTLTASRKTPLAKLYGKGQTRYLELLEKFPLRPIRSEADLDAATEVIHQLIDQDTLSKAEDDYLDVLTHVVEKYEKIHYPIEDPPAHEMLAYFMELKELTQAQVSKGAGIAVSTVSELLSGKRKLTRGQIEKLAKFFHTSPAVFLPAVG